MPSRGSFCGTWARAAIGRPIVKILLRLQTSPTARQLRALFTMSSPVLALLGLSVTSDLNPQRVEQRTSPAAFDVAGLLVASNAMELNDAIICARLAGGIG